MAITELVRVYNAGREDFTRPYDGKPYTVRAGKTTVVPREWMLVVAGDPTATNDDHRYRHRLQILKLLDVYYGVYNNHEKRESLWPKLEFYPVTDDEEEDLRNPIPTVLADPDGTNVGKAQDPTVAEKRATEKALADLQAQVAALQTQLEAQETAGLTMPVPNPMAEEQGEGDLPSGPPQRPTKPVIYDQDQESD